MKADRFVSRQIQDSLGHDQRHECHHDQVGVERAELLEGLVALEGRGLADRYAEPERLGFQAGRAVRQARQAGQRHGRFARLASGALPALFRQTPPDQLAQCALSLRSPFRGLAPASCRVARLQIVRYRITHCQAGPYQIRRYQIDNRQARTDPSRPALSSTASTAHRGVGAWPVALYRWAIKPYGGRDFDAGLQPLRIHQDREG